MSLADSSVAKPAWSWRRASVPLAVVGAVVGLALVGWLTTPEFVTYRNLQSIVRSAALIGIIAVTMTGITMAGSFFSLSVSQTAPWPPSVRGLHELGMAGVGRGAHHLRDCGRSGCRPGRRGGSGGNPIVVTLAVGAVLFGLGAWLTDNKTVRAGTDAADWIGTSRPLGVPTQTWAFVVITVISATVLTRTRFGRELTLVGANRLAAAASGLHPGRTTVYVFGVSSLGAALAGIFIAAQFGQGRLDQFDGADIDSIAAILVGGAAIQGGEGSASRTAVGAVFIAGLQNLMVLRGFSFGVRVLFVGLAILISVSAFTVLRNRRQLT